LGLGGTIGRNSPNQIGTDTDWVTISAGGNHVLAFKTNNTIYLWGCNVDGQLGLGFFWDYRETPNQLGTDSDWSLASAGGYRSYTGEIRDIIWLLKLI